MLSKTLAYSDHFNFPLTLSELWYWQIGSQYSQSKIRKYLSQLKIRSISNYYFLPRRRHLIILRSLRARYSQAKWPNALKLCHLLQKIPTIRAVFITGALSMNNCPKNDDIDLMVVTSPHTLWITRLLVVTYLKLNSLRRPPSLPEHSSPRVNNKFCDNLYLDTFHLPLTTHNLYLAHEILQAKCVFDRGGIHHQFLTQNSWVKKYLPIAYRESLKKTKRNKTTTYNLQPTTILLWFLNLLLFLLQYLYMFPKKTSEKIGLGFAFFHPTPSPSQIPT